MNLHSESYSCSFAKLAKKIQVQPKRNVLDKSNKLAYEQKLGELQGLLMVYFLFIVETRRETFE